jgi:hypothetical protein
MNSGISARQGSHQLAQKLTTMTWSRHCDMDWLFPSRSGKVAEMMASAPLLATSAETGGTLLFDKWPRNKNPAVMARSAVAMNSVICCDFVISCP